MENQENVGREDAIEHAKRVFARKVYVSGIGTFRAKEISRADKVLIFYQEGLRSKEIIEGLRRAELSENSATMN